MATVRCFVTAFLAILLVTTSSADWTLKVAHSNDLWFQLDEIQADDSPCWKPLPEPPTTVMTTTPSTTIASSTEPSTTTTLTTTTTTAASTQSTEDPTPTNATESTTESTPSTSTTVSSTESTVTTTPSATTNTTELTPPPGGKSTAASGTTKRAIDNKLVRQRRDATPIITSSVPYFATKVNSSVPHFADPVNSTVPHFADKVNSTIPHFADKVNSSTPHFADKVNSSIPHFADKVNSTVPHFADKVNSTVPHFADKVNPTVPHFADKVNSTVPYFAEKVNTTRPYFADKVNSTVPYFADKVSSTTPKPNLVTTAAPPPQKNPKCYGGVARHRLKAEELKSKSLAEGKSFLHLNAGGMLGGNIWFPILGSEPAADSIQMLNYHAVALGYRDFDEGVPATVEYLTQLKKRNVTVLCANMDVSKEPGMKDLFQKSAILNISNQLVGIVGYIGTDADYLADTGKIVFLDEVDSMNAEIDALFDKGAKFIIALGSAGYDGAKKIFASLHNIDLMINGGGKSVLQYNGDKGLLGETPVDTYPVVAQTGGVPRLLTTTSRYGKYLGDLEMTINNEGRIVSYSQTGNPILLQDDVPANDPLQLQVDDWERTVLVESEKVIGRTKLPIVSDRRVCWYDECSGASMMADAARWYLESNYTSTLPWKDSIAGCVWHGGALSSTSLGVTAGNITFGDILMMFPYANVLAIAEMAGKDVVKLFERSVEYYNDTSVTNQGEFLHVSGMRVEYDLTKPTRSRVSRLLIRDTSNPSGGLEPIKEDATYRICMPSFIARGGSRYEFMEDIPHNDVGIRDEIALRAYIGWTSPLAYGNEGRLQFVSPYSFEPCPNVNVVGTVFLTIFLTLLFAGLIFAAYKYLYPKLRDRRGSLLSLIRMNPIAS